MSKPIEISPALLEDLRVGLGENRFDPVFGDIYLGLLNGDNGCSFGHGAKHYGMVRGPSAGRPLHPLVPFAPITSKKKRKKGVMILPKGVLPPKDGKGHVVSYILLYWHPIRIAVSRVHKEFTKKTALNDEQKAEAKRLIEEVATCRP